MKVDYIVVGAGLAGIAFCETLFKNDRSFVLFDDGSQQSSQVAAGLYNPVILKRFTKAWKAGEQLKLALSMYSDLEKKLNRTLDHKLPIYRLFASIEEQNNWFQACDDPALKDFLSAKLLTTSPNHINAKFGFGKVLQCGRIDTALLTASYKTFLKNSNQLIEESFHYDQLRTHNQKLMYRSLNAKHVIFAEGFGLKRNPYFNYLPLNGTKGELLTIHAPQLQIDFAIKSSLFIIPLGDDRYRVGSTFNRSDKSKRPTNAGREELIQKLDKIISCDYTIQDHHAAVRPTVKDRKPLVGNRNENKQMYVLNGLGTRGVMIAPYIADELFRFIEQNRPLSEEISISRFD